MFGLFRKRQKLILTTIATLAIGSMAFSAIAPLFLEDKGSFSKSSLNLVTSKQEAMQKLVESSFDSASANLFFPQALFTNTIVQTDILDSVYFKNAKKYEEAFLEIYAKIAQTEDLKIAENMTLSDALRPVAAPLVDAMQEVKKLSSKPYSEKHFVALKQLFVEKSRVPFPFLYRYLENLGKGKIEISEEDLAYFGLKNPEDFFGKSLFQDSISCFIKTFESRIDTSLKNSINLELKGVLENFYQQKILPAQFFMALGIDPEAGLNLFLMQQAQNAFRQTTDENLLLDPLSYSEVSDFANDSIVCQITKLKKEYIAQTFEEVVFQETFFNQKKPFLADVYEVQIRSIDKDKSLKKIPKKKLYEVALASYDELCGNFPYVFSKDVKDEESRLEVIKKANLKNQGLVEKHVQAKLYKDDPSFYLKDLQALNFETKKLYFADELEFSPLKGFNSSKQLKDELSLIPDATPVCFDVQDSMIYEICLIKKGDEKQALSFEEALNSGLLKAKVKKTLEASYKDLLKKNPSLFLTSAKKVKTLDEAYEDVLNIHFKDLKTQLEAASEFKGEISPSFLVKNYPKLVLENFLKAKNLDERLETYTQVISRKEIMAKNLKKEFDKPTFSLVVKDEAGSYLICEKMQKGEVTEKILSKQLLDLLQNEAFKKRLKAILVLE
jgi:hypothetical protein